MLAWGGAGKVWQVALSLLQGLWRGCACMHKAIELHPARVLRHTTDTDIMLHSMLSGEAVRAVCLAPLV